MSAGIVSRVERACAQLVRSRQPVTFVAVAARAGVGRATLYRDPSLRALVNDHRSGGRDARTLSGLADDVAALRTSIEAVTTKVRRHDEVLRHLDRRVSSTRASEPRLAG